MKTSRHMAAMVGALFALAMPSQAAITVRVAGPGGSAEQILPDAGGPFDMNLPLAANAQNEITVTARDAKTNEVSARVRVTQLSLQSVVVASIRTEPLPPQRIEELVNSGAIQLNDPANFNVSQFVIILTIGGEPVSIDIPVGFSFAEPQTGYEIIKLPNDPGGGGGNPPKINDQELIVFDQPVFIPGEPEPMRIPGVIVIEGRIKTLKEFFSVRLLMMNTSGIFTLQDVTALLSFPDGGLSHTLPSDGLISFESILPGDGNAPGQKEREFIIRGDEIGVRRVRVDFGGSVIGPGIDASNAVPFNGSAESTVEVKGPPNFLVEVVHPDTVNTNAAYELTIKITNSGQTPALYTSLDLDLGFDALFVDCSTPTNGSSTTCSNIPGPVTRSFGHIFPGQQVSVSYLVHPLRSGPITSCLGISDQNITLRVSAGLRGCLTGQFPPTRGVPDGIPAVNVAPLNNTLGVNPQQPVVAFFSEAMSTGTITTGQGGTFNVFTTSNSVLPGVLRFDTVFGRTVAVWQYFDGVSTLMPENQVLTVYLTQGITDPSGNPIFNEWVSTFRTTSLYNDMDPPQVDMLIEPPVDPNFVLPGQIMNINVHLADQGSGPDRVELYQRDLTATNALFTQVDQKMIFQGSDIPARFAVDTATLAPGHTYLYKASALDRAGNVGEATIAAIIAASADPPVLVLPEDPTNVVLQGIAITIAPVSISGGVKRVEYYLDGTNNNVATVFLPPFQTTLGTLTLPIGAHTVTAVAVDGLNQTGSDELVFNLVTNVNEPRVSFDSGVSGGQFITGSVFAVSGRAEDPTGIQSVQFFLNGLTNQIAVGTQPFLIDTTGLATGDYEVIILASNKLGRSNNTAAPESRLKFSVVAAPPGLPPPTPTVINVTEPDDGTTTVTGTSVPGATVTIVNTNFGFVQNVVVASNGNFVGVIAANGGDGLRLTAFHAPTSPSNSAPTLVIVPPALVVTNLVITPDNRTFTAAGQFQDFTVTAQLAGGGTSNVTARSSFSSSAPGIASVNQSGRMVAQNSGLATLTATFKTNTAQAAINVDIVVLTNFTASVSKSLLIFPGDTASISVTGQYSNGTSAPLSSGISYGAANPGVAVVNGAGVITAITNGSANFSVGVGGLPPKQVSIGVAFGFNPPPTTTILSPANGTQVERSQFITVNVQAVDLTGGVVRTEFRTSGAFASSNSASYSVRDTDTRGFNFIVPTNASVGGTIVVSAWSVDVGGLISSTATINLAVADLTAPLVSIVSPTNAAPFNGFQTVVVQVAVSDAVGVSQVRYETESAFQLSGVSNLAPPIFSATIPFSFILPPNAPSSALVVRAFASDLAGNTRTSAPITLIMTDNDITPPETIITSAATGPSNSIVTLSFMVTDGMDDLDHVAIYYRRNGIGTFNRWTDPDGTNILGRYFPNSGSNGVVVFNATKMGGDGAYEFYSIGLDTRGNRELPPVPADQSFTVTPFFVWTAVTSGTFISATDTAYDNLHLRLSNAFVVIEGTHSFRNVDLFGTSVITHASTTLTNEGGFQIDLWSLHVATNAALAMNGRGYLGGIQGGNDSSGQGPGNTNAVFPRSGASHGGIGSTWDGPGSNPVYGNFISPLELGAGGSSDGGGQPGGNGGGRIRITAFNIAADGALLASGNPGAGNRAGSGAGGSIYLSVRTLSGSGLVRANGGTGEMGAGGGRIAVHYIDMATKNPSLFQANGGIGSFGTGGNGTVFLLGYGESDGTIVIDGQGIAGPFSGLPIPPGVTLDNLILQNSARVVVDDPIVVNSTLQVLTGSILTHSQAQTNGLSITARDVVVDGTSSIDASAKGYTGGGRSGNPSPIGRTLHNQNGASPRSAGSYGGYGSVWDVSSSAIPYGTPYEPVYLGSGGSTDAGGQLGGHGGGRINITASNSVTVQGVIRADGESGAGNRSGSGSGGSIWIQTSIFQGAGEVTARGGAGEMGGGGGRIRADYAFLGGGTNNLNGTRNISARGGRGSFGQGSAGSVLLKKNDQQIGDLIVDEGFDGTLSALWSPWVQLGPGIVQSVSTNELVLDGAVRVLPGGLVGMILQPNISNSALFKIVGNTASTVVVQVSGASNLTMFAASGSIYRASYAFDNVTLRRGAWGVTADRLVITDTLRLEDVCVLTHFNALTNYEPRLEIGAGTIVITSNALINVSTRGYPGGFNTGNSAHHGITVGLTTGALPRSAASHGGRGSVFDGTGSNPVYGDPTQPQLLGSGGSTDGGGQPGGNGGGRIRLNAGSMMLDGRIIANGGNSAGNRSGAGSGGSVWISVGSLSGTGLVSAIGGANEMGAGGGRIAVYYQNSSMTQGQVRATGGQGAFGLGGHGSVYFKQANQVYGDLVLQGTAWVAPDDTTPYPDGFIFDNVIVDEQVRVLADVPVRGSNVVVKNNSRISHTLSLESGVRIEAHSLLVESGSTINVSSKGYRGGIRSGNPNHYGFAVGETTGALPRSAASHGGRGSVFDGAGSNPTYGNPIAPTNLGAGGSSDGGGQPGGHGGGRITVTANQIVVHGTMNADGMNSTGNRSGAGAGGSIWLTVNTIGGSGLISANGGAGEMGAGGGRIAIHSQSFGMSPNQIQAIGGAGAFGLGGVGSVVFQSLSEVLPDYVIDGAGVNHPNNSTALPTGMVFRSLSILNGAKVTASDTIVVSQAVVIATNALLTHPLSSETGVVIRAGSLTVDATSSIDVSGRGYRGGARDGNPNHYGFTVGQTTGAMPRAGGSYGGAGTVWDGPGSNPIYGSATNPVLLGSGGSSDNGSQLGGHGGGRIDLWINGPVLVNGSLLSDGQAGFGNRAGSGSGGSILLRAQSLNGSGIIRARGGAGEMGGGGGRVAVFVNTLTMNTNLVTAGGGAGAFGTGGAGTVYFGVLPGPFGLFALPSAPLLSPSLSAAQLNGQQIIVVWDVGSEGMYALQFSPSLMPSTWTTLQYLVHPVWTGNLPTEANQGFIRIIGDP